MVQRKRYLAAFVLLYFLLSPVASWACSGIAIGKNASASGNAIFARTDDYSVNAAQLFVVRPAGFFKGGDDWEDPYQGFTHTWSHDSYKFFGVPDMQFIPDMGIDSHKYFDNHGINEKGFSCTGTNSTGVKAGLNDGRVAKGFDEPHIAMILLAECASVQEGITLAGHIVETQGAYEMGVVPMGDKDGVWVFEIISGHRWVASRVPDDKFVAVANIQLHGAIDLADTANFRAAADIFTFLEERDAAYKAQPGWTTVSGDLMIMYDPLTNKIVPHGTPGAKVHISGSYSSTAPAVSSTYRRWRMHQLFSPSLNILPLDKTNNATTVCWPEDPRPNYEMYVKPDKPISLIDVMLVFGDKCKDVPPVDFAQITGIAGRAKVNVDSSRVNSTFAANGAETDPYSQAVNGSIMRTFGVISSSTCHFVEVPPDGKYPPEIGGRGWFTMGPSEFALWMPHYGLIADTHEYFQTETRFWGFQPESAYWIFHDLSRICRSNREFFGWPVREFWTDYAKKLIAEQSTVEEILLRLYAEDPEKAKDWITEYHWKTDDNAFKVAKQLRTALVEFAADLDRDPTESFVPPEIEFVSALYEEYGRDSSSGCNAGFAFALLALIPLLVIRKRK